MAIARGSARRRYGLAKSSRKLYFTQACIYSARDICSSVQLFERDVRIHRTVLVEIAG
jgi:hypothetical protein